MQSLTVCYLSIQENVFFFFAIYIILVAGSLLEMYLIVQFIAHSTYDSSKKFQTEYSNFMKEISLENVV